jgi:hypothetical protein
MPVRVVTLTLEGWVEEPPSDGNRIWLDSQGDVLALTTVDDPLELPSPADISELQAWCRDLAESRGAGLIETRVDTGPLGATVRLIYKRLDGKAYIFTGMFIVPFDGGGDVWTVVSGERGLTGIREAIVTKQLMDAGKLTIQDYKRSFAQDPYEPSYSGVDRSVLRFVSDDDVYDEEFPDHPLSKVRRVLATLPGAVRIEA